MKVYSAWSGHDCSFVVLNNGYPEVHAEYERYIREKEPAGDGVQFMFDELGDCDDLKYFVTCRSLNKLLAHRESFQRLNNIIEKNNGQFYVIGHHQSHAANAFYSSNFDKALVVTIDGGGFDPIADVEYQTLVDYNDRNMTTTFTVWEGDGNKLNKGHIFPIEQINIGGVWTRCTRYIFKLQSGWPRGHQAGTVMAMAAIGNPDRFRADFYQMLKHDSMRVSFKPPGQPGGAYTGNDPKHPYLNKWAELAETDDQTRYDLAAGLQSATEQYMKELFTTILAQYPQHDKLCVAGGVTLNSVVMGKMLNWFDGRLSEIYATPTPHDGGMTIGAAQYVWHHILHNPRIQWEDNFTPYLGFTYDNVTDTLQKYDNVAYDKTTDEEVLDLLDEQNIIAVFGGGSESGRRALGNRSILADPRSPDMKDLINEKVKHRQWFRPFAPSILREEVSNWFEKDIDSPYMSFVVKFKQEMKDKVPAVVHFDDTARLQTVTENDNKWYYNFIKQWHELSGVPIVLNTSFNDREPICETAEHALNCFLRTNIDYLYFYDEGILVRKK